jgi:CheY-like chemotaxis protein
MPRLLVIDDDPAILLVFRRAFADSDVVLRTAATAREGLEALAGHRPDVVLLDVQLPDRAGLDLYREVRQLDGTLPVIFFTVSDSSDTVIEAMKLGAYDYLSKPLDLGGVRQLLARAFEVRRLMHVPVEFRADHGTGAGCVDFPRRARSERKAVPDQAAAELVEDACLLIAHGFRRDAPTRCDRRRGFPRECRLDQGGVSRTKLLGNGLIQVGTLLHRQVFPSGRGDRVSVVEQRTGPLASGPRLNPVDGAGEVGPVGGLAAEDATDSQPIDVTDETLKAVKPPALEQGQVDLLFAVVTPLGTDSGPRPRSVQAAGKL